MNVYEVACDGNGLHPIKLRIVCCFVVSYIYVHVLIVRDLSLHERRDPSLYIEIYSRPDSIVTFAFQQFAMRKLILLIAFAFPFLSGAQKPATTDNDSIMFSKVKYRLVG